RPPSDEMLNPRDPECTLTGQPLQSRVHVTDDRGVHADAGHQEEMPLTCLAVPSPPCTITVSTPTASASRLSRSASPAAVVARASTWTPRRRSASTILDVAGR